MKIKKSVTFHIVDDDVPTIRLAKLQPDDNSIDAGDTIIFSLQRINTTNWNNQYIDIEIDHHESIPILWRLPNRVLIQAGQGSTNLEIKTLHNVNIASNASIQVSITEDQSEFKFGTTDEDVTNGVLSKSVTVFPSPTEVTTHDRIAVANRAADEILEFLPTLEVPNEESSPSTNLSSTENTNIDVSPIVSISSSRSPVNEGETIYFQLSTTINVSNSVLVEVKVTGNSIESNQTAMVNIKSGERIGILPISTINDDKPNGDRTITATIQSSDIYDLGTESSKTVTIS